MRKNFDEFDLQEAMHLAQTDAGKQLMAMLRSANADQMNAAMASAKAGDYDQVKKSLAAFMADPQAQALLRQLQEERHG